MRINKSIKQILNVAINNVAIKIKNCCNFCFVITFLSEINSSKTVQDNFSIESVIRDVVCE